MMIYQLKGIMTELKWMSNGKLKIIEVNQYHSSLKVCLRYPSLKGFLVVLVLALILLDL